jgi:uncharacterized damage-inducible protein DinB
MGTSGLPEPWLRGTRLDSAPVLRAVLHALEQVREDAERWCEPFSDDELNIRALGLPPLAWQLRHISRSIDRLITYAEGRSLDLVQLAALKAESEPGGSRQELFAEFFSALEAADARIRKFQHAELEQTCQVGRKQFPTTVAGLLVHVADHSQRHVGQLITTAKVLLAARNDDPAALKS